MSKSAKLWDEHGTTLRKQDDCHCCGEDEIGSHFEQAWCHACGWRGTLHEHRAAVAALAGDWAVRDELLAQCAPKS
jgi:hypothetical protein